MALENIERTAPRVGKFLSLTYYLPCYLLRNSADPFVAGGATRSPSRMKSSISDGFLNQPADPSLFPEDQSLAAGLNDLTSVVRIKFQNI